jgi:polar amino acid transport system permease protein
MKHKKNILAASVFTAVLILAVVIGYKNLSYNWQWYRVAPYFFSFENGRFVAGVLLQGVWVTFKISAISLVLALITGMVSAFARLSPYVSLRVLAWCYVETIRNTPLLIQIFVIYFVISPVLDLSAFTSAVIALSLFEGAYSSEIIRSGIINIPKGQFEAAQSIGLPVFATYYKVVVPQMLRQTLPMLAGQSVSLIKDSALVSTISIYDLTMQGQKIVSETFLTFEIWFAVALCYLSITATLSFIIRRIETRMRFVS